MNLDTTGKRIQFLREHFGLSKPQFVEILNSSSATIYRLEGDKGNGPSENFLNALKIYFMANPDWIMTGQGDMFITAEEYIDKGIEVLGNERFSAGIIRVLKDSRYEKLQSLIQLENMMGEKTDNELQAFLQQMAQLWKQGDEQLRQALGEFVRVYLEGKAEKDNK